MNNHLFQMRECPEPSCGFRFPSSADHQSLLPCPRCGLPTSTAGRLFGRSRAGSWNLESSRPVIVGLLDNIRSAYNVGSLFRTADGAGLSKLILCGISPTPTHGKVAKTSLGAETSVPWSYHPNALDSARRLKDDGYQLWSLESGRKAASVFDISIDPDGEGIALVVGNENAGIDPAILDLSDKIVELPMAGRKGSLNVVVAFGIATYLIRHLSRRHGHANSA